MLNRLLPQPCRILGLVLGDQLDHASELIKQLNPSKDIIWMAEVSEESTHVWSSKQRTALFLSAMRHFSIELQEKGFKVNYVRLDAEDNSHSFSTELTKAVAAFSPQSVSVVLPGDYRVLTALEKTCAETKVPLQVLEDTHFFSTPEEFKKHSSSRKQLRLEYWYRDLRKKTGYLMIDDEPVGGQWNFDIENRHSFDKHGPKATGLQEPIRFAPDSITQEVIVLVNTVFSSHPGSLRRFDWAVTRREALEALSDFVQHRLPLFGKYEDAMWEGESWLYHSQLSACMNLKLLSPREVCDAVEAAYKAGAAPLEAVEGYIRQVLGWREYVRGIYWLTMPGYERNNSYHAIEDLPEFFWTGKTDMPCLADALRNTLDNGYAHHIQRLMVIGLYALMYGVEPKQVHEWFLAVYVDAVEWVELPNTVGMSQAADNGMLASKPYIATGKYISRMSNHCKGCKYNPDESVGPRACPYTTLYWDFLIKHEKVLSKNPRIALQVRNVTRLDQEKRAAIAAQAEAHRKQVRKAN